MNIAPFIIHAVFLTQILFLFFDVSQSVVKLGLIVVVVCLFLLALLRKSEIVKWTWKSGYETDLVFLIYYMAMLSLGFVYGYSFSYVAVNIMFLLPLFIVFFIPRNINSTQIMNIILFYAVVSLLFSFIELIAWKDIGWIHNMVLNSIDEYGRSKIYSEEHGVKAFGIFPNAVSNGLLLVFGLIISLARLSRKFQWFYLVLLISFVIVIYFTYTRNNYLTLFFAFIFWEILSKAKTFNFHKTTWRFALLFYIMTMISALIVAIKMGGGITLDSFTGDSVQSRVVSWGIIFTDYFITKIGSFHMLFGFGLTQLENELSPEKTYWAIDNGILMVYLSSGVVGVLLFLSWLKSALNLLHLNYLIVDSVEQMNIRIIIIALMAYFINGVMNATIITMTFLLPLIILISKYARQETILRRKSLSKVMVMNHE